MPTLSLRLSQPVTLVMVDEFGPSRWFVGGQPPDRI